MMRVLIVHNTYRQPGGEDISAHLEASLLRSAGHEVYEYCRSNDEFSSLRGTLRAAFQTMWSRDTVQRVEAILGSFQPDVMHVNNTWFMVSPAVYWVAKQHRIPVVQSLRNYRLLCPNAEFLRQGNPCELCKTKWLAYPGIFYGCYHSSRLQTLHIGGTVALHHLMRTWEEKVDIYIALTEFVRGKFIEGGFPAERIAVKPNFLSPDPGKRAAHGGYALFVGRLSPEKGVRTLFRAWQQIAGVPLKVVGDGPLMDELQACLKTTRLPGVEVLGHRAGEEVLSLMKGARFLVLPSEWYETFGRVAIEAFACGVPVLASRLGAMAEIVEEGRTGLLFRAGDAQDLVEKVRWAMEHPEALERMGERAREVYEEKYTPEKNYQMLLEIYARAIHLATQKN